MSRDLANTLAAKCAGATHDQPFGPGHDVWKVGGKVFAAIGAKGDGLSVKCASVEDAQHLQDLFGWPKAPYFHRSWVHVPLDAGEGELAHRLAISYDIIRKSLTKKAQADLPPVD
ncbi:MmcQ/YjbR family DNA-binding protein [Pseudooctadecabacter jejudonensis]|uniref:MmcQ/YjbR family DNA-binding protein n=1 Tax=Pseudooctadecabacter jejudonensis TaxID=1391910 RepID=A0A1Y5RCX4_9RHOB|nr:MmcQ/YjbR family DNA-binding protein [Pseudooctadecabacter jejudonensis]SLN14522.1 hypothetical protein PSJ8397_00277 [Pseudooctadecabacter jejudonensis]